jgi:hypothetical protein
MNLPPDREETLLLTAAGLNGAWRYAGGLMDSRQTAGEHKATAPQREQRYNGQQPSRWDSDREHHRPLPKSMM